MNKKFGIVAIMAIVVLLVGALAAYAKGTTEAINASDDITVQSSSGIGPDSALYFLQTAIDRISLALTFDQTAKAEKGLQIARKRLIEVREMIVENKLDAAKKAEKEHDRALSQAEKAIRKLAKSSSREEIDAELKLEKELEEHDRDVELVRGNLELHIKVKGRVNAEHQALIDSILESMQNKTGKVKIVVENKKSNTKIRIVALENKSKNELDDEVNELERKSGLLLVKKERAEQLINASAKILAEVKTKLQSNLSVNNSTAALKLVTEADVKLQRARQAFNESKYGEAFGQATAAGMLARNADKILSHVKELDEDDEQEENELEIEVEVKRGIAHIKIELNGSKFKYSIPFTNETDLFSNISAKTGLSLAEVSSITELEVKESSKSSDTTEADEESEEDSD